MITLPPETIERLLVRPEDMPDHVRQNILEYRNSMLKILEDHMVDHNQQYLIELDANQSIVVLEKVCRIRYCVKDSVWIFNCNLSPVSASFGPAELLQYPTSCCSSKAQ